MAITRRKRREINLVNLCRLRSGALLHASPTTRPSVRRPGHTHKTCARRSPLPAHPGHTDEGTGPEQSQWPEDGRSDQDVPGPSPVTDRIGQEPPATGISDNSEESLTPQNRHTYLQRPSQSPKPLQASEKDGAPTETGHPAYHTPQMITSHSAAITRIASESALPNPQDPEDVGIPSDGKWDLKAAYEWRFCFEHGEEEWLLENTERWMYPSDFNVSGAEATLEARLQKYESAMSELKLHNPASRAECNHSHWSQVDTPIQRGNIGDKVIYLIRWKLYWTAQSNIEDLDWVRASYKAQNEGIGRRCSARVEKTAAIRAAKREEMMVVINLEV